MKGDVIYGGWKLYLFLDEAQESPQWAVCKRVLINCFRRAVLPAVWDLKSVLPVWCPGYMSSIIL